MVCPSGQNLDLKILANLCPYGLNAIAQKRRKNDKKHLVELHLSKASDKKVQELQEERASLLSCYLQV